MNGIYWSIASALGFGIFQAFNRKAGDSFDPILGTFVLIAVSAVIMIAIAIFTVDLSLLWAAPVSAIISVGLAGFIHFFLGWTLITISQKQIGAARTGAVVGTMPLFGLVIDLLVYHESFSWQPLLGVFLVVAGVFLVSYR